MLPRRTSALRGQLLISTFAIALVASPAAAQDATATDGGVFQMLGRIIFGAGTAKVAIDTPQAVTAREQADLDRAQPNTIGDVLKGIPGVQATGSSARPLGQAFNIRGIGNTEQTASEARIAVSVDGAPKFFEQYRLGSFFGDFELFKRVEVLRGPASSTLYGAGAIGGAIAFTTKDAGDFLEDGKTTTLRFKSGYNSNGDTRKLGVIFATKQGNAEYLGSLNYSSGGEIKDGGGTVLAGTAHESMSGLLKGKWTLGQDEDQSLTLSLSRTDTDLDDTLVAQTGGAAAAFFGTADIHSVDDTVSLKWNNSFANNPLLDLSVQLSYTNTTVDKSNFSLGMACAPGQSQVLCEGDFGYATTTLKVENTAEFGGGGWDNRVIAGVQLSRQERSAHSSVGAYSFHPQGTDTKVGIYAQGEFVYDERLTLIPGVRIDFGQFSAGDIAGGLDSDDTAISPKLAVMYKINDSFSVFGSLAHTERMPTLDERYSTEAASTLPERLASMGLAKEEADSVELGFTFKRQDLLSDGDSLQLKLTGFHNDLKNMIATTPRLPGGPAVPYYSNITAAELWGAELEASYDADRWFSNLSWSKVRTKNKNPAVGAISTTLPDTPAEAISLTIGAKLPAQHLNIGWTGYYYDNIKTSSATTTGDSYQTHDMFVKWSPDEGVLKGLDVNFAVENMFDEKYKNNLALDNGVGRNYKLSIAKSVSW
ncbi:MAG: TonB-dependent receptor [Cypionkella sp.]|uniref:TonB-dependent receptor domain-containing protein n=1 Tax=Cypionkella sp. TaxID=2811411 RepID=UPI002610CC10|nr:TonB-dependent receptor [Cypionkella sp.]MDB5657964.1 TonB-dependent receptor [Cypionkella sp.]